MRELLPAKTTGRNPMCQMKMYVIQNYTYGLRNIFGENSMSCFVNHGLTILSFLAPTTTPVLGTRPH